jgi:hypothetical protein
MGGKITFMTHTQSTEWILLHLCLLIGMSIVALATFFGRWPLFLGSYQKMIPIWLQSTSSSDRARRVVWAAQFVACVAFILLVCLQGI